MKIDLHIHSKDGSDGRMELEDIFNEALKRGIRLLSITDHDSLDAQEKAVLLAKRYNIKYISGLELNISFKPTEMDNKKAASLDLLVYGYDPKDSKLNNKINELRAYRRKRAMQIIEKLNRVLEEESIPPLTKDDISAIEQSVNGSFGRPHIANYLIKLGIVSDKREAFDKYLKRCNVPKLPLSLEEASSIARGAGGKLFLAHPNDPSGTSLIAFTDSIPEQQTIIEKYMLEYLDGIECWHSRHTPEAISSYLAFSKRHGLMVSGGSDCHQDPVIMGTVDVPLEVAQQFGIQL